MLTLTGPGGSGKTRLSLQLAADAVEQFPDGVFWVPLQGLQDAALVEGAIAASIGAENDLDDLAAHIADKRMLLLLDNFEQVIEAASMVSLFLAGTPNVKALITSREPLHLGANAATRSILCPKAMRRCFSSSAQAPSTPGFGRRGPWAISVGA